MYLSLYRPPVVRTARPEVLGGLVDSVFADFFGSTNEARAPDLFTSRARFDVLEKDGSYEALVEIPGVTKEDIEVNIEGTRITVKAEAKPQETEKDGARVIYAERRSTRYARTFELPQEVDDQRAEATYENGVLKLTLPKKDAVQPKRLQIN